MKTVTICPICKKIPTGMEGYRRLRMICDCGYSGPMVEIPEKDVKKKVLKKSLRKDKRD